MAKPATRTCPAWCARIHGDIHGEDDTVHVSSQSAAGDSFLRLAATIDPVTGTLEDGPFILYGQREMTLDQARHLVDVLENLILAGQATVPVAGPPDPAIGSLPQQSSRMH